MAKFNIEKKKKVNKTQEEKIAEWNYVEDMIMTYQKQFKEDCSEEDKRKSEEAIVILINKFTPLFNKYMRLLKRNEIEFKDLETRYFMRMFLSRDTLNLLKKCNSYRIPNAVKQQCKDEFKFVVQTYGVQSDEDVMADLQHAFMRCAYKYRQTGRNFCGYIYNVYRYEVGRIISAFIKNPINIEYRYNEYDEVVMSEEEEQSQDIEEQILEMDSDFISQDWYNGDFCSNGFEYLEQEERRVLAMMMLQNMTVREVYKATNIPYKEINKIKARAVEKLYKVKGIPFENLKIERNCVREIRTRTKKEKQEQDFVYDTE